MLKYKDTVPQIDETAKVFPGAIVVGEVSIGKNVSIWYNATVRGDMDRVDILDGSNIQDNAVVHTNTFKPSYIGKHVTVGHSAIIHGAKVNDYALIGMGAIILDGAEVGEYAMVGAGALVPPGKKVPPRTLVVGNPMRIVRELTESEIEANIENSRHYVKMSEEYKDE